MEARLIALLVGTLWMLAPAVSASARPAKVEGVYYLKIRAAPGFDAAERGMLAAGDRVSIIEEVGRWARVRLPNNTTGYVSRKYLVLLDRPEAVERPANAPADRVAPARRPASAPRPDVAPDLESPADATAPPEAPAAPVPLRPRPPDPWTAAHVEEVRTSLRDLATSQDRLAGLVESRVVPPATGESGSGNAALPDGILGVPPRQVAFWLAVGYVLGWSTTMMVGRWRQRRHRHRVRI